MGMSAFSEAARVSVLDNSCGIGRLLQFAEPDRHVIYGCDTHGPSVNLLAEASAAGGIDGTFLTASVDQVSARGMDLALINPAFSLSLSSATMEPFDCTTWGRYGRNTSALSHEYALSHAMRACRVVIALLPRSFAESLLEDAFYCKRIRACLHLPANAFLEEGANVATSVVALDHRTLADKPVVGDFSGQSAASVQLEAIQRWDQVTFHRHGVTTDEPSIDLPVTGNPRVRLVRKGRQLRLKFECGFMQAKVENAIYIERVCPYRDGHRYPKSVRYTGQGCLDIEVLLLQDDPMACLERLCDQIRSCGARLEICSGIAGYLRRRARRQAIFMTPLRHDIFVPAGSSQGRELSGCFDAVCKQKHAMNPKVWGSPRVNVGDVVSVAKSGDEYTYRSGGHELTLTRPELEQRFDVPSLSSTEARWVRKHAGRAVAFPEKAAMLRARARRLGLDQWLYSFALEDCIEMCLTPGGVVAGHKMGLGKGRLSAALALLQGGKHNLAVVEAGLIDELVEEFQLIGLADFKVIEKPSDLDDLANINIISYSRLRQPVNPARRRFTYAKALRHRIHTLTADEGHLISHIETQQTRALFNVAAKKRYALSGTAIANYPRDIWPVARFVAGDGVGHQPFGHYQPCVEARNIKSMAYVSRGAQAFAEEFTCLEWVSYEFSEDLQGGAKREVPSLRNLDKYRSYLSNLVLRRVWEEPDVASVISVPEPVRDVEVVPWDDDHLARYLAVAEEFRDWWIGQREAKCSSGKGLNLVALLAQINEVFKAANNPASLEGKFAGHRGLTSKQRAVLDWLIESHNAGEKTLLFARNPAVLEKLHEALAGLGIEAVLYTGNVPRKARVHALKARWKNGPVQIALMSYGVGQTGLNLHQACRLGLYNREWSPRQEHQAEYRALRPQQKHTVKIKRWHLPGSLDEYQARMVEMKADCASAGLDYATPEFEASDFNHWVTLMANFVDDLADLKGVNRRDLRAVLAA